MSDDLPVFKNTVHQLDQNPTKTIAEKFNTYRFADYKEHVIDLLQKVTMVSVETMKMIRQMEKVIK